MRKSKLLIVLFMVGAVLTACDTAPKVDWELSISGAVSDPYSVSFKELAELPQLYLDDVFMDKSVGEDETGSWSGVALDELFTKAGVYPDYVTVTAIAVDGYVIEISKDELSGSFVALKENGEWIYKSDPEHGPIRLVCPQTPANRWVYQLIELQVNK